MSERASAQRRHQLKFPHRHAARVKVAAAVASGRLTRPNACEGCGAATRLQAHHPDYAAPLVVRWLCSVCHSDEHGSLNPDRDTFGARIRRRRRTLKRSQGAVARSVGVSPRFLSKLENDGGRPSWEVAVRLADALDVSLDYLAGRSG